MNASMMTTGTANHVAQKLMDACKLVIKAWEHDGLSDAQRLEELRNTAILQVREAITEAKFFGME